MPIDSIRRGPAAGGAPNDFTNRQSANGVYVDGATNIVTVGTGVSGRLSNTLVDAASSQTLTNKVLVSPILVAPTGTSNVIPYASDSAIAITSHVALITKTSGATMTVAAPGAAVGSRITITSGTDFAHVITFTGGTLADGTTGLNTTVTMTAFAGSSITVVAATATLWVVESQNNLTSIA